MIPNLISTDMKLVYARDVDLVLLVIQKEINEDRQVEIVSDPEGI